eukprot:Pgem_evm1s7255
MDWFRNFCCNRRQLGKLPLENPVVYASTGRFAVKYARRTDFMPEIPQEIKHHPSSVNLIVLKQLFS